MNILDQLKLNVRYQQQKAKFRQRIARFLVSVVSNCILIKS